jgi:hypothetical protein
MKNATRIISYAALAGSIVPAVLFLAGAMPLPAAQLVMLISTIAWFVATPLWMEHGSH